MQAWRVKKEKDSASPLVMDVCADPKAQAGELLVQIHAAGVTPTELLWYPTTHTRSNDLREGAIPGHEFAGVVFEIGQGVTGFDVGQEIYGMNDWFADGATAEFCITRPEWVAPKPRRLSFAEAAAVPIGALTAWQGLFDHARLNAGETILIHGASGGVGVFAVQLAKHKGARVLATGSAANADFLKDLGAARVIDYRTERFEDFARDVNVVFDAVGGTTLRRSWEVLAPAGRLVTIAADSEGAADERVKKAFFIVEPRRQQLAQIAEMLDQGQLRAFVRAQVPMSQATAAYAGTLKSNVNHGKVVVVMR
jgi:NADPH:quinone reductase-like Zn-dependent oxidoreductase